MYKFLIREDKGVRASQRKLHRANRFLASAARAAECSEVALLRDAATELDRSLRSARARVQPERVARQKAQDALVALSRWQPPSLMLPQVVGDGVKQRSL